MSIVPAPSPAIPYKIAVLVYVFNDAGALLLLHRTRPPNQHLYSPIGGKLEQAIGESPYACALREIHEEIGVELSLAEIQLLGIVSERAFPGAPKPLDPNAAAGSAPTAPTTAHWLMFCFEVTKPLNFPPREISEGRLEWFDPAALEQLTIPQTDRQVIWPLVRNHSMRLGGKNAGTFFSVHIDCQNPEQFATTYECPL